MSTTLEMPGAAATPDGIDRFLAAFPPPQWALDGVAVSIFEYGKGPRDVALAGAAVVAEGHEQAALTLLRAAPLMMVALQRIAALRNSKADELEVADEACSHALDALTRSGLPVAQSAVEDVFPKPPPSVRSAMMAAHGELRALSAWAGGLSLDDARAYAQRAGMMADALRLSLAGAR